MMVEVSREKYREKYREYMDREGFVDRPFEGSKCSIMDSFYQGKPFSSAYYLNMGMGMKVKVIYYLNEAV